MAVIIITGTPGTGKTNLAKRISKLLKHKYINVNTLIKKHNLAIGFDKKRKSNIISIKRLKNALIQTIKNNKNIVIDSHLSHYLPRKYADICIVTKSSLKRLKKRLEKKGYSHEKVRENLDAEIFDICYNEAIEAGHKPIIINTNKPISSTQLKKILNRTIAHIN